MTYSTDLTDKQWQVIEKLVDKQVRKRKHSLRSILNGIFYLVKTGCQWRMPPVASLLEIRSIITIVNGSKMV